MILFDTDVCIDLLRGNRNILLRRAQSDDTIAVSFMSVGELYYLVGKSDNPSRNQRSVEELLLSLEVIQSDAGILRRFARIKADLERSGHPLPDADALIAATTLEKSTVLITGNTKHFERIPGLKTDSWR